jgi:predicted MFS family arabinose efflux permease
LGWRESLFISGSIGIIATLAGLLFIKTNENFSKKLSFGEMKKIFLDKDLFYLSIGVLAVGTGNALLSSFLIYYLEGSFGYTEALAGLIASIIVIIPIFSSLWGGRLYDRTRDAKLLTFMSGVVMAAGVSIVPFYYGITAVFATILGGIGVGFGITVGFAAAREISRASAEYEPLSVAWVNFISLFGVFLPPLIFSFVARNSGYFDAWVLGGLITFILSIPVLKMRH